MGARLPAAGRRVCVSTAFDNRNRDICCGAVKSHSKAFPSAVLGVIESTNDDGTNDGYTQKLPVRERPRWFKSSFAA